MHPETHASLMSILNWAIPVAGYPFVCAGLLGWIAGGRSVLPVLVFWTALAMLFNIAWRLPVRCNTTGCNGMTKKTGAWAIDWKSKVEYHCTTCKAVYELDVYHPPFFRMPLW
jgi:hypothetical protein